MKEDNSITELIKDPVYQLIIRFAEWLESKGL